MVALPNIGSVLNNLPARVDPRLEAVRFILVMIHCDLHLLHSQFIHQLKEQKKYDKIGAVGYAPWKCWSSLISEVIRYWYGGSVCIRFAGKPDLLDTVVICHPGKFTIEEVENMKIPNSWVCTEGKILCIVTTILF